MGKIVDLTGQKFGRLTVISIGGRANNGSILWNCLCDCGNKALITTSCLTTGHTKSCGCIIRRFVDLSGKKFGRLTVKNIAKRSSKIFWQCQCDCGREVIAPTGALISGHTKSCGCINQDRLTIHGQSHTRLWNIWEGMIRRCCEPASINYPLYGGRGIQVCDEWKTDFIPFYKWALAHGYQDNLSIDRIDVNGNYTPENCRWVTMKTQQNNKRSNKFITFQGETHTVAEWADILGMSANTLWTRLHSYNWSVERALTEPVRKSKERNP